MIDQIQSQIPEAKILVPVREFLTHTWQEEVWNHPARFKIIRWHRRARKTTLGLNKLIKESIQNPGEVYGYIGPTYRQAKSIVWRDPQMLKRYCPRELLKKEPNESELYVEFFNNSILQILGSDEPDSIRGKNLKGVVFDEYSLQDPRIWYEIVRPILAENGGWAWFLYTPKGRNHAYDQWVDSDGWGDDWAKFMLTVNVSKIIDIEALEQAKKEMPERLYRQEFLCEFLDETTGVFKGVRQCVVGELQAPVDGRQYCMGVDLAKSYDFTVLVVVDAKSREVVSFERFQDVSWVEQKYRIQQTAGKYNNAFVVIDSTGVGDPVVEDLRYANLSLYWEDDKPGYKFTQESKRRLIENLVIAIEQRLITFPLIEELVDELNIYDYKITPKGKIEYGAPEGKHDDCVTALALACWGIRHQTRAAQVWKDKRPPAPDDFRRELFLEPERGGYGWKTAERGGYV